MIAYTAEYAGGDMRPCDDEIADARWFSVDALPQLPSPVSISRHAHRCDRGSGSQRRVTAPVVGSLLEFRLQKSSAFGSPSTRCRRVLHTPVRSCVAALVALLIPALATAQAPPPPPTSVTTGPPPRTPGLSPELAEAAQKIRDGEYVSALAKIDAVLATDAKNPQARFLKGVVQTDQAETDAAIATFQGLIEDYPELPEPYNNLAVIWAQQGQYEKARSALELALATRPDYAIAHENLGDVYARLASMEYDRAIALDKTNKSAQTKLTLVRELFAVAAVEHGAQAARCRCRSPRRRARNSLCAFPTVRSLADVSIRYGVSMLRRCRSASPLRRPATVEAANPQVDLDTTAGKIRIELYPDAAPKTVENFLAYVKAKHYDGTQFHRVIDGFMIQGGGYTTDFRQKPTRPPDPERGRADAARRGCSTCRAPSRWRARAIRNSATAQFFINVGDNKSLNFREPSPGGYRLHGVRQGGRRHGRSQEDREDADWQRRSVPEGRSGRARDHQEATVVGAP